jgi:hypothetical protein
MVAHRNDPQNIRARSTVLGPSIHHATEHRAQIAGALVAHGIKALDLDALDVWALGDAEGLGECFFGAGEVFRVGFVEQGLLQ